MELYDQLKLHKKTDGQTDGKTNYAQQLIFVLKKYAKNKY